MEINWGDKVEIVCGQYKGIKAKVTTIDKSGYYWLSEDKNPGQFSRCYGPLRNFQIRLLKPPKNKAPLYGENSGALF